MSGLPRLACRWRNSKLSATRQYVQKYVEVKKWDMVNENETFIYSNSCELVLCFQCFVSPSNVNDIDTDDKGTSHV